jgi:Flp pilus assembly protein TadD
MLPTLEARRPMTAIILTLSLTLVAAGCTGDETGGEVPPVANQQPTTATDNRTVSHSPSTYGIDEVVTASMTMETLFDVEQVEGQVEQGPALEVGEPGFLLPDLGLVAGDGADHQTEGETLYQQRQFLAAAAHFQVAVEEKPGAWYSSYLLGLSLWKAGDLDGAASALQRASQENPEFPRTQVNLSRVFNDAGRFGEALAAADRAAAMDSENATAHYLRGRSLANLSRFADAESALQSSLQLDPGNGDVWNRLGLMLLREGRDEEALVALERALASGPATVYMHNNLGLVYERSGRLKDAEQQFMAGLAVGGDAPRLTSSLARVRDVLGVAGTDPLETLPELDARRPESAVATLNP